MLDTSLLGWAILICPDSSDSHKGLGSWWILCMRPILVCENSKRHSLTIKVYFNLDRL